MKTDLLNVSVDGLTVAFRGCISEAALAALAKAKAEAEVEGGEAYASIMSLSGYVKQNGAKGGYRYIFNQGPMAAKWQIKHSIDPNQWNLLAKMPSGALLDYGLKSCIKMLEADLKLLGGRILENSVSRFDVCADILCEGFEIDRTMVSAHSATRGQPRGDLSYEDYLRFMETNDISISGLKKIETLEIGSIKNRQITIYNKRKQAIKMHLMHWFDVWGRKKEDKEPVWRVEFRAVSKHLREWNIKSLDDLVKRAGDMVGQAFVDIRYLSEVKSNITRSKNHPIWDVAIDGLANFLRFAVEGAQKGRVIKCYRDQKIAVIKAMITGLSSTLLALDIKGQGAFDILGHETLFDRLRRLVVGALDRAIEYEPKEIYKKMRKACKKYHFIDAEVSGFRYANI